MKGLTKLSLLGALSALIAAGAYAQPPGLAGLVWLDDKIEFDLNAGNLVTTGALSTTIALGNQPPVRHTGYRSQPKRAHGDIGASDDYTHRYCFIRRKPDTVVYRSGRYQPVSTRKCYRTAC